MVNWLNKERLIAKNIGTYATIWKRIVNEDFPRGVMVGNRCLWNEDEVDEWIANQPKQVVMGDARERPAGHLNLRHVGPSAATASADERD